MTKTAAASNGSGNNAQTYNAQGATNGAAGSTAASSQGVTA
ncbi:MULTISPECIES: hypothetical protein [unclassified Bradyrhizobium]|nr:MULTISPECIES: hypothetical protein [unclassified Bradyrhizobium]